MIKQDELEQLFQRLPSVRDDDGLIWLDGHLLRGSLNCIRFVIGHIFLDFDKGDVVSVEEQGRGEKFAISARIAVRSGAVIRDIGSSEPFEHLIWEGRIPFAVAIRELAPQTRFNIENRLSNFTVKEREFLEKHSIVPRRES